QSLAAHNTLSIALLRLDQYEESIVHAERAIAIAPNAGPPWANKALALVALNHLSEGINCYEMAMRLMPGHHLAQLDYAHIMMRAGRFLEAWPWWHARYHSPTTIANADPNLFSAPFWTGQPLRGKSILVISEQGAGDSIQFSRFLPVLVRKGAR